MSKKSRQPRSVAGGQNLPVWIGYSSILKKQKGVGTPLPCDHNVTNRNPFVSIWVTISHNDMGSACACYRFNVTIGLTIGFAMRRSGVRSSSAPSILLLYIYSIAFFWWSQGTNGSEAKWSPYSTFPSVEQLIAGNSRQPWNDCDSKGFRFPA